MFSTIGYWICLPFAWLLRVFYTMTNSYGVALILFTLVIKLILLPFQMKSKKSMIRMNRMSGKMQEIQKKYANNQMKMNEELQKFYEEEGINPMSGCLWSMLPLPIMLALYSIIREPIVYFMNFGGRAAGLEVVDAAKTLLEGAGVTLTSNAAYEQIEIANIINSQFPDFISQHSGWISGDYHFLGIDLTVAPGKAFSMLSGGLGWAAIGLALIPVLSAALQLLVMKISMSGQPQQAAAANKSMMLTMPLISLWIGFTLPAALGVYWIAQSAFSAVQEFLMTKFFNKKIEEEEERQYQARQADRQKRQEEGRKRQEEIRQQVTPKQTLREKQKAAQAAKAEKAKKAATSTTEAGRVGDRPYARGRSYKADRYDERESK